MYLDTITPFPLAPSLSVLCFNRFYHLMQRTLLERLLPGFVPGKLVSFFALFFEIIFGGHFQRLLWFVLY